MKIVSKKEAMKHLTPSRQIHKFDNGKYQWYGSQKHYIGKEAPDIGGVKAVFVERRHDSYGPYAVVLCVTGP